MKIDDVLSFKPCGKYSRKYLQKLAGDKAEWTVLDVLDLDIPAKDKFWLVLREELIPARTLHLFACNIAEQALLAERKAGREPHTDSWAAIQAKRDWLDGKITDDQLSAAWAAWSAAESAAWSEARSAAIEKVRNLIYKKFDKEFKTLQEYGK
jgi:hypothetical protein